MTGNDEIIKEITRFALDRGVLVGICDSQPMYDLLPVLSAANVPFVSYPPGERIDPARAMPQAKSIIVLGMPYEAGNILQKEDYHLTMKNLLQSLADHLSGFVEFGYKIFVDTGPLPERGLARKAGLGFIGKNRMLINERFGSMFNIGYMLTELQLDGFAPNISDASACGNCGACIKACPGGALAEASFDCERCVSYLTQRKGMLSDDEMLIIGENIYGCMTCQSVCPHNGAANNKNAANLSDSELLELLRMTRKSFSKAYDSTAVAWRGLRVMQRNALIVLGNRYKKKQAGTEILNAVTAIIGTDNEILNETAKWAFNKMTERGYF